MGLEEQLTQLLRAHGELEDSNGTCECGHWTRADDHAAHVARVVLEELALTTEWGLKRESEEYPFSTSTWTAEDAQEAARYNNERWGRVHHVVSRLVSPWVGVTDQ